MSNSNLTLLTDDHQINLLLEDAISELQEMGYSVDKLSPDGAIHVFGNDKNEWVVVNKIFNEGLKEWHLHVACGLLSNPLMNTFLVGRPDRRLFSATERASREMAAYLAARSLRLEGEGK